MRWKIAAYRPEPDREEWHSWFAWRPVLVGDWWVWLESIERKLSFTPKFDAIVVTAEYRDANGGRGKYPAGWP